MKNTSSQYEKKISNYFQQLDNECDYIAKNIRQMHENNKLGTLLINNLNKNCKTQKYKFHATNNQWTTRGIGLLISNYITYTAYSRYMPEATIPQKIGIGVIASAISYYGAKLLFDNPIHRKEFEKERDNTYKQLLRYSSKTAEEIKKEASTITTQNKIIFNEENNRWEKKETGAPKPKQESRWARFKGWFNSPYPSNQSQCQHFKKINNDYLQELEESKERD